MFEAFQGRYDVAKYSTGFDPKLKDEDTVEILEHCVDLMAEGKSQNEIRKALCSELGFKGLGARGLVLKSYKKFAEESHNMVEDMLQRNVMRLTRIYNDAMAEHDRANALKALDQLSKLCGLYVTKVQTDTKQFVFHIGIEEEDGGR